MSWLLRDHQVLATLEIAEGPWGRGRGLLGRDGIDGALLLRPARAVHTVGMRFPIDVAFCDTDLQVLRVVTMRPHRIGRPCLRARVVIEAEAGTMASWELHPGDTLEIRE